jgi:hypothetical protein|nr:MAG TPA: hypothetical protein [Caudoviricetes sp.]
MRKEIKISDELRDEYLEAYDVIISKIYADILKDGLTDFNLKILQSFRESKKDFEKRFC